MARNPKATKEFRCAIYTRKSTEHGLELEFNSLDAQREACEAYIKSQASEGWTLLRNRYDDPAFSGGNMDRPALQRLLKDIEAGSVDVVVVYKIDRLTRSLADFAKLVEIFDAKSVSFVAVTQQFNTTTSMGRLTLNVLLSFAQFERELASERVRDKVAASRKKGKWTGGTVPLGYDVKDKKLVADPAEAKTVRFIFQRYIALQSMQKLIDELDVRGVVTKRRNATGKAAGGIPFTYGPLAYLLKNRVYLGEIGYGGSWYPGEHEPILDRGTFEKVQDLMKSNSEGRTGRRQQTGALLTGLIYDDRGNRMSPSFSTKGGVRHRYYVSSALLRGRKAQSGSISRIPARDIENAVLMELRQRVDPDANLEPRELIAQHVTRLDVGTKHVALTLKTTAQPVSIAVAWTAPRKRDFVSIEGDRSDPAAGTHTLIHGLARAHVWLRLLADGTYDSIERLAESVDLNPKVIRSTIRLAFLPPSITALILKGGSSATPVNELVKSVGLRWS
jgi:site-specific DNA recombinase